MGVHWHRRSRSFSYDQFCLSAIGLTHNARLSAGRERLFRHSGEFLKAERTYRIIQARRYARLCPPVRLSLSVRTACRGLSEIAPDQVSSLRESRVSIPIPQVVCDCWRTSIPSGIWESDSRSMVAGVASVPPFPPGEAIALFFFRWGKFDYIIGGFTGLWFKIRLTRRIQLTRIWCARGFDFYDGLKRALDHGNLSVVVF